MIRLLFSFIAVGLVAFIVSFVITLSSYWLVDKLTCGPGTWYHPHEGCK